jgi:hypothetical protein
MCVYILFIYTDKTRKKYPTVVLKPKAVAKGKAKVAAVRSPSAFVRKCVCQMADVTSSAMEVLKKQLDDMSPAVVHAGLAVAHRLHVQCGVCSCLASALADHKTASKRPSDHVLCFRCLSRLVQWLSIACVCVVDLLAYM